MSGRGAAFFDVDGTIVASNIVAYGVAVRTARMSSLARRAWTLAFAARLPWYLALDTVDRAAFQRAFYRLYRNVPPRELEQRVDQLFAEHIVPRIFPAAEARIAAHRERGEPVVLVTGSIAPIVAPLAARVGAEAVLAPGLEERNGGFTGALTAPPLAGSRKAEAVAEWARAAGVDRARSTAYADSRDDLPLLESVGRAAVVNPGRRLRVLAERKGWEILHWPEPPR